jgi:diguanylate cyclase (GGDEF)-like protein
MMEETPEVTTISDLAKLTRPATGAGKSFLVMIHGEFLGRRFEIEHQPVTVGRGPDCTIQLQDDSVSRRHCRITPEPDGIVLDDLGSTNGTYVNSEAVTRYLLQENDRFQVGRSIFKFLTGANKEHAYHEEIYRLKTTDALTGAHNKRAFDEELQREVFRFLRYHRPLSLIMLDIDHFKLVNDRHGHLTGDHVLSRLGELIAGLARPEDIFCRYGGEEFTLLLPETDLATAMSRAETIRAAVERERFFFDNLVIPITISAGVAEAWTGLGEPEEFVAAADRRLYRAKENGRNRVEPQR